ncbi:MAG: CDP-diacylglycerol--serine O-phosphatidyltransferase [Candidatus Brocadiaceae bacterium]
MKIKETIPNIVTLGNMVCGFTSILCVLHQRFEIAAWLIVAAMILDAFDGRLARMMKSSSKIGAQLDSMADLVTFGVAPALLVVSACNSLPVSILWGIGLFFMICSALRLARFNSQKEEGSKTPRHFFTGLPTTLSGGTVAQLIILDHFVQTRFNTNIVITLLPFITFALAVFMVSKIPFFNVTGKISIKQGIWAFALELSAAALFFAIAPELALSTALSIYLIGCALYGIVKWKHLRKGYSTT